LSPPIRSIALRRGSNAKKTAKRLAAGLASQLFHIRVSRALHGVGVGTAQRWSRAFQNQDASLDRRSLIFVQRFPPPHEFVRDFDVPHVPQYKPQLIISQGLFSVGVRLAWPADQPAVALTEGHETDDMKRGRG